MRLDGKASASLKRPNPSGFRDEYILHVHASDGKVLETSEVSNAVTIKNSKIRESAGRN
jgi:hypothetical protein